MKGPKFLLNSILYALSVYFVIISVIEYLTTFGIIEIPYISFSVWFNGIFLLIGGFILGIIFLKRRGVWNKIVGWIFILNNIIMFRFLLDALV